MSYLLSNSVMSPRFWQCNVGRMLLVMSLKTDDEDIRDVRLFMEVGGNGDYYLNLMDMDKKLRLDCRIAMSGGNAPHEVKMAIANLYRALANAGLCSHPLEDAVGQ